MNIGLVKSLKHKLHYQMLLIINLQTCCSSFQVLGSHSNYKLLTVRPSRNWEKIQHSWVAYLENKSHQGLFEISTIAYTKRRSLRRKF